MRCSLINCVATKGSPVDRILDFLAGNLLFGAGMITAREFLLILATGKIDFS